jgi:SNF2 family DNA or RNA helicase
MDFSSMYEFPCPPGVTPMGNQRERFNMLLNNPYAFDLSDMGTGKTFTSIWAADFLTRETGTSALIFAPLSTLGVVWGPSYERLFGEDMDRALVLKGSTLQRARTIRENKATHFITNYESLLSHDFREAVLASDISVIVLDEVTAFKNANSARSKALRKIAYNRVVWGLTATPRPQALMNVHGIVRAVRQDYSESATRFKMRTHVRFDQWTWVPKGDPVKIAYELLQPSIRVKRTDCYELPPTLPPERRKVELSKETKALYKELRKEAYKLFKDGDSISVANEASMRTKLLQVAGGAVYTERGTKIVGIDDRARELLDVLEQTDEKIVTIVPYTSQIEALTTVIRKAGHTCACINGKMKPKDRTHVINRFQNTMHPRIILTDPRCLAHGVELYAASIIVFYLPIDSNELYQQAIGRLTRRGQKLSVKIIQLYATALEASIYNKLEANETIQGAVLAALTTKDL